MQWLWARGYSGTSMNKLFSFGVLHSRRLCRQAWLWELGHWKPGAGHGPWPVQPFAWISCTTSLRDEFFSCKFMMLTLRRLC